MGNVSIGFHGSSLDPVLLKIVVLKPPWGVRAGF